MRRRRCRRQRARSAATGRRCRRSARPSATRRGLRDQPPRSDAVVEVEPARPRRRAALGIDRDDLEVGLAGTPPRRARAAGCACPSADACRRGPGATPSVASHQARPRPACARRPRGGRARRPWRSQPTSPRDAGDRRRRRPRRRRRRGAMCTRPGAAEARALRGHVALGRDGRRRSATAQAGVEAAGDRVFVDAGRPTKARTSNAQSLPAGCAPTTPSLTRSASARAQSGSQRQHASPPSRAAAPSQPGPLSSHCAATSRPRRSAERRERSAPAASSSSRPRRAQRRRRERRAARRRAAAHQADAALLHDLRRPPAACRRLRATRGSCRASDGRRTAARRPA